MYAIDMESIYIYGGYYCYICFDAGLIEKQIKKLLTEALPSVTLGNETCAECRTQHTCHMVQSGKPAEPLPSFSLRISAKKARGTSWVRGG